MHDEREQWTAAPRRAPPPRWPLWTLGAVLFAQGVGKALDLRAYLDALARFQRIPAAVLAAAGVAWTAGELVAGAGLLTAGLAPRTPRGVVLGAASLALVLALAYLMLNASAFAGGLRLPNCTCFGRFLPQPLSLSVVFQDVGVLAWCGWALRAAVRWQT